MAGIGTGAAGFVATLLMASIPGLPLVATAILVGLVIGLGTLIVVHVIVTGDYERTAQAVTRIETLVNPNVAGGDGAVDGLVRPDGELVGRLEESAEAVAERLRQLKQIENYRQEFLGDVSHELQTPIFAVQGFAETLLDGALEDHAVNRAFVEKILRHSKRLSTLVNDLSHIAQIETGSLKMNVVSFNPSALVADVEESLGLAAEPATIELSHFVGPDVERARGDEARIRQVLENLVSNGIKYNEPGGRVEITVRRNEEGGVIFSVTDDGIGLSDEDFPRVTERFFRVDKSRSRERGGTGLGLAIVKHILEAHGSGLRIHSQLGRGSTFSFELPADDSPAGSE